MSIASRLRDPAVAVDWASIYAAIGDLVDRVAGTSCAGITIRVEDPTFEWRDPLASAIADRTTRTVFFRESVPASAEGWWLDHYPELFHEVGHIAWNRDDTDAVHHALGAAMLPDIGRLPLSVIDFILTLGRDRAQQDVLVPRDAIRLAPRIAKELQTQVFALQLGAALHTQDPTCGDLFRATWVGSPYVVDDVWAYLLVLLLHARADLAMAAATVRSPFRELIPKLAALVGTSPITRRELHAMHSSLQRCIQRQWGLRVDLRSGDDDEVKQQLRALNAFREPLRTFDESLHGVQRSVAALGQDLLLSSLARTDAAGAASALLDRKRGDRERTAEMLLVIASRFEAAARSTLDSMDDCQRWQSLAEQLRGEVVLAFSGTQAAYRARHAVARNR